MLTNNHNTACGALSLPWYAVFTQGCLPVNKIPARTDMPGLSISASTTEQFAVVLEITPASQKMFW